MTKPISEFTDAELRVFAQGARNARADDLATEVLALRAELAALRCAGYDGDAPGIVRCGRCGEHHQPDLAPYIEEAYREHVRLRAELAAARAENSELRGALDNFWVHAKKAARDEAEGGQA
jgi:hypothetical protein